MSSREIESRTFIYSFVMKQHIFHQTLKKKKKIVYIYVYLCMYKL